MLHLEHIGTVRFPKLKNEIIFKDREDLIHNYKNRFIEIYCIYK